jgi:hypothetical protein
LNLKKICEEKNALKKDKPCPIKDCCRRYSSRIALRAHIRKRHGQAALEAEEFK